jgi:hypothetical protein
LNTYHALEAEDNRNYPRGTPRSVLYRRNGRGLKKEKQEVHNFPGVDDPEAFAETTDY